jgi:cytochrome c oxidase subunit 2
VRRSWGIAAAVALVGSACAGYTGQSALEPAGPQAAAIYRLWDVMLPAAAAVYLMVMIGLVLVIRRRRVDEDEAQSPAREAVARRAITTGIVASVVLAFGLLLYDFAVARALNHSGVSPAVTIQVTGHRWWWEVEYQDPVPQRYARTANEIHVPVGQPVLIKLDSHDVIHSFWVPSLAGKKDLIPGHHNELLLRADVPGVYRGQCAEFCGAQHAKMALLVVAEPPERFAAWLERQRAPAQPPADSLSARGRLVFETAPCGTCHTVASTTAAGRLGPDLTHMAGRRTIAAGTLANTPGNLGGWILDPQTVKPGAQMPPQAIGGPDLRALVAYLETLH